MAYATLSHALTRLHRLRALVEQERRRSTAPRLRLLRLQRLLLKVQARLASALSATSGRHMPALPA